MPCHSTDRSVAGRLASARTLAQLMDASEFAGVCDGFRAPDEAVWVSASPLSEAACAETQALVAAPAMAVRSNFWWGPRSAAAVQVEHLAALAEEALALDVPPADECVLVALWRIDEATALTATLSLGDAAVGAFAVSTTDALCALAHDHDDNSPVSLWDGAVSGLLTPSELARVLHAATVPGVWADVCAAQDDARALLLA